jgi:hypothetical protein
MNRYSDNNSTAAGKTVINGKTYEVENSRHGLVIKHEVEGWDGPSVVLCDKNGDEYNAPIIDEANLL